MIYHYAPQLRPITEAFPPLDLSDPVAARTRVIDPPIESVSTADWTGVTLNETHASSSSGSSIPLAIYRPSQVEQPLATLVFFHGGGFVLGDERSHDPLLALLVRELDIIVISVGYRLAPEHPCPAALDDGATVLQWCETNANEQQIDLDRVALGGQSAGAAIAAGVALDEGRTDDLSVSFLYLGEPVLDPRLSTSSMLNMDDTPVWRLRDARTSWQHYLGDASIDQLPSHASPATCERVDHLPPTYITANEIDPLRDEAFDFARRLLDARVPVEFHLFRGAFHGTISFDVPLAEQARSELVTALRRGLVNARQE